MAHQFKGAWITDEEFYRLAPRNVFFKQLDRVKLSCQEHRNRHILFRREFDCPDFQKAMIYISADDYYKLYINGEFVTQGPTPAYHFQYNYNTVDVTPYLKKGKNVLAVHTLYQGLINRTWQSGDNRHGLILDLALDGKLLVVSDEQFKTAPHSGYTETGTCGYNTQFLEQYDSSAPEVGFEAADYDDSSWQHAKISQVADYTLVEQASHMLETQSILPVQLTKTADGLIADFGSNYVGCLQVTARGRKGDLVTVRCAQELNEDGTVRYQLRANCTYEEPWLLADGESRLEWFDYKVFRYVQLLLPEGVQVERIRLIAQHYPFKLQARMKPEYAQDPQLQKIWQLCVHSQHWGVQEVIQDCMERERGFYLGDGCYSGLANMILTGDDSMVRRIIDDAFATDFITDTLVTCMNCSFMQECAEYPLILVQLVLWHYNLTGDRDYLEVNYQKVVKLLEAYRSRYEQQGLLRQLDKWCVVEWPKPYRHGYDVDITEGKVCQVAHVAINAYYLGAVQTANRVAAILGHAPYRQEAKLLQAFMDTFFVKDKQLFQDSEQSDHISLVGNCFVYAFNLCDNDAFKENFIAMLRQHGIHSLYLFSTFPTLMGLARQGRQELITEALLDDGAWLRMLREGATTTFEGWGKDTKWNTSLFHLTISYAAVFLADVDLKKLFEGDTP